MEVSKHSNGIKITTGKANVYINPESEVDSGVVIYTDKRGESSTNDNRLIIEAPGEYEFQGIYIKGTRKNEAMSFTISYNEREVFYTKTSGIESIPEDEPFDAVLIETEDEFDASKIGKISYPAIYNDKHAILGSIDAETVKTVNLKKLTPEAKNIFILQ